MRRTLFAEARPRVARRAFAFVLATYVFFSLLDVVTTAVALGDGGREGNPVAARVFAAFGNAGLLTFKALVVALIIAILIRVPRRIMSIRVATYLGAIFAAIAATVVLHNVQADAALLKRPHHRAIAPASATVLVATARPFADLSPGRCPEPRAREQRYSSGAS